MKTLQILVITMRLNSEKGNFEKTVNEAFEMLKDSGNEITKINYFLPPDDFWKVIVEYKM